MFLEEVGELPLETQGMCLPPSPADRRREAALEMAQEQGAVNRRQLAARGGVSGETARVGVGGARAA